jgi:hypothetical protein
VVAAALGQVNFALGGVDLGGRQLGRYLGAELGDGLARLSDRAWTEAEGVKPASSSKVRSGTTSNPTLSIWNTATMGVPRPA